MRKAVRLRLKGTIKSEFLEVYGNESPVYLPSANSIKCCSPPASLEKQILKIRPLTGRNVRKVDGLFLSAKSKKEVNYNDKTENP